MPQKGQEIETVVLSGDDPATIDRAVRDIVAGKVVAFPTDTVYGIGAMADSSPAIVRIYRIKERARQKALPVLVANQAQLESVVASITPLAERLIAQFWPGGLTLILPKAAWLPRNLTAGGDTVAVRMPNHPLTLSIIGAAGSPLAVTSANLSNNPSPRTATEVFGELKGRLALIVDGGPCPGGVESSVVDVSDPRQPPRLLREGALSRQVLAEALGQDIV